MSKHTAVWIDHKEAKLFAIDTNTIEHTTVHAPASHIHNKHPRGPFEAKAHPNDAKIFFHDIAQLLANSEEILVVGPSTAKLELLRYLHAHAHVIESKIVGVETVDHPTDGQLVAYAKKYFARVDKML
jgi:stalled ribosome rescue protein Dom34